MQDPVHGNYISFSIDTNGRISSITDSFGRTVSYIYNSNYDLTNVTYPGTSDFPVGVSNRYVYDDGGRLLQVIDQNGSVVVTNIYPTLTQGGGPSQYFLASQVTHNQTATFTYGTNEVTCTDYKGFVHDFYNDGAGNITKTLVHNTGLHSGAPSTYETDYTYDANGQKTQQTNPSGNKIAWTYDSNGNVLTVKRSAPAGATVDIRRGSRPRRSLTPITGSPP